jgi:hypothetical protein
MKRADLEPTESYSEMTGSAFAKTLLFSMKQISALLFSQTCKESKSSWIKL